MIAFYRCHLFRTLVVLAFFLRLVCCCLFAVPLLYLLWLWRWFDSLHFFSVLLLIVFHMLKVFLLLVFLFICIVFVSRRALYSCSFFFFFFIFPRVFSWFFFIAVNSLDFCSVVCCVAYYKSFFPLFTSIRLFIH